MFTFLVYENRRSVRRESRIITGTFRLRSTNGLAPLNLLWIIFARLTARGKLSFRRDVSRIQLLIMVAFVEVAGRVHARTAPLTRSVFPLPHRCIQSTEAIEFEDINVLAAQELSEIRIPKS